MKRIFIFLLLSVAAMAADPRYQTGGMNNGRWWTATSMDGHGLYISGLVDMLAVYAISDPKSADHYLFSATIGDLISDPRFAELIRRLRL